MGWEGLAVKVAAVIAAAGLLWLLVRAYGRTREQKGKITAERDVITEGVKRHETVDEILAEPVPTGGDLRVRMRARLNRARKRLLDRHR